MDQISFFSAEASGPRPADLAGVLCGPGQIEIFGRTAARLSVAVDEPWRARALAAEFTCRGIGAGVVTEDGRPLLRTAFRVGLIGLANAWCSGPAKVVPRGFRLTGAELRLWALAAGQAGERDYLLAMDEQAPQTHAALADALGCLGLPCQVVTPRGGGPAIRVTGRRRLAALGELLGAPPPATEGAWPGQHEAERRGPIAGLRGRQPRRARSRTLPGSMTATIW
ncbi:hypothetical protein [Amycolatopsis taiwanensis]|uniref:hypothetical protein n=1 Tax=Amycolatopsis taiwanensis TaxID=342230 RepID=UPI0004B3CCD0|nr:hypothetical protein [Amycolatopsis taiwanensis]